MSEQAVYDQGAIEQKVSGSSFYAGMRILPKAERSAMFAIYGFCRAVDDIVDEPGGEPAERRPSSTAGDRMSSASTRARRRDGWRS